MRRLLGTFLLALAFAPAAQADSNLLVGIVDDQIKWTAHPKPATAALRDLGIGALRVPLTWRRGSSKLTRADTVTMNRVVGATFPMRIVLTVAGLAREAPKTDAERGQFCSYVRDALTRYPLINDVTIWNEVNSNDFWQPQFANGESVAPGEYALLLARCYDTLKPARPRVNLMTDTSPRGNDNPYAVSNASHSPGLFVRKLGEAYRAMGRQRPLFDNVGHHPYGDFSLESPFARHPNTGSIGQGDYDKLVLAYAEAFAGTDQPTIGSGARIYYLEDGFETTIDATKRSLYNGVERARTVGSEALHAEQLVDAVRFAYCQPYVASFFNFLLTDEKRLCRVAVGRALGGRLEEARLRGPARRDPRGAVAHRQLRGAAEEGSGHAFGRLHLPASPQALGVSRIAAAWPFSTARSFTCCRRFRVRSSGGSPIATSPARRSTTPSRPSRS